ncbi:MAG: hypothetical protein ABJG47_14185 [Ekhidna sp.]
MIDIYLLRCPVDLTIKYIGSTQENFSVRKKLYHHKYNNWLSELKNEDKYPIIEIIDSVESTEQLFYIEFYVQLFSSWGFELMNIPSAVIKKKRDAVKRRRKYRKNNITNAISKLNEVIDEHNQEFGDNYIWPSEDLLFTRKEVNKAFLFVVVNKESNLGGYRNQEDLVTQFIKLIWSHRNRKSFKFKGLFYELSLFLTHYLILRSKFSLSCEGLEWDDFPGIDENHELAFIYNESRIYLEGKRLRNPLSDNSNKSKIYRNLYQYCWWSEEYALHGILDLTNHLLKHFKYPITIKYCSSGR